MKVYRFRHGSKLDWYVDSVSGDDGNSGKMLTDAFQTIAQLLTVFAAGEKVGLARGSEWREQLTMPGIGCKVTAVGTGARPILDCADVISAGWSKTGGRTNVYQVTLTTNFIGSEPCHTAVWEDGVRLTWSASLADLDAAPGTFYCADHNTINPVVYVHTTDSANPAVNGLTYEMSTRRSGIYGWGYGYARVSGINTKRNLAKGGSLKLGQYALINNCLCEGGSEHSLFVRTGSRVLNTVSQDGYYPPGTNDYFIYNDDSPVW